MISLEVSSIESLNFRRLDSRASIVILIIAPTPTTIHQSFPSTSTVEDELELLPRRWSGLGCVRGHRRVDAGDGRRGLAVGVAGAIVVIELRSCKLGVFLGLFLEEGDASCL